ncbi:NIF system FeS cluster assembly, NifU [Artemisia annua]|uniref:NIF system FeS cluster assembly, NifU n=1 Tax=Artemisia annua TaxID=35608 RepID=A0A2U1QBU1_ARTAN|nr:NIF system FeS cluster assembly, NifU [Artemisia annua]
MTYTTPMMTSHLHFQPPLTTLTHTNTRITHRPLSSITTIRNKTYLLVFGQSQSQSQRCITPVNATSGGLYSAEQYELNPENVDKVLDDVRPYLIADGGNVDVVGVLNGVVSLKLQGACGTCPSSTTTMKMGIERVLKEKFGDAVKDIVQVYDEQPAETTVEAVNGHLEILRPAITNFGGSVEVLSVQGGECIVKYTGPESIGSGVKAAIKEKFTDIENVVLTE